VVFVTGIVMLIMGSIAVVFSAMTQGTAQAEMNLVAQVQNEQALLAMVNDLQTTDTVGSDEFGLRYFEIKSQGAGVDNKVVFRKVESFNIDAANDVVLPVWGAPIQYFVDAQDNLVRVQGGTTTVAANRISQLQFAASATGCITITITSYAGRADRRMQARNTIQITPRNALKL
jgi:hypothetical protein